MSRESQPEPLLKAEQAKLDTSVDSTHNRLQQQAVKDLSSPLSIKESPEASNKDLSAPQKSRQFYLHADTTPQEENKHQANLNNQQNQETQPANSNTKSNESTKTFITPAVHLKKH